MRTLRLLKTLPLLIAPSLLLSCAADNWGPDELANGTSTSQEHVLARGRELYGTYCVGCHGEAGDGNGPAARFLNPKPRDFRKGRVKFAAVPSGTKPRDEDLLRILDKGLSGTSMPTWNLLPTKDKVAIIAYLKTFGDVWEKEAPGPVVAVKPDPWRKHPERGVEEGEKVYHGLAACSSCHPAYATKDKIVEALKAADITSTGFRDDMYNSVEKDSDWGAPIKPPDFLVDRTKFAQTREELVQVIASGVGGTAMPSWGETLTDRQLWGLAYYVESLIQKRGTQQASALKHDLANQK